MKSKQQKRFEATRRQFAHDQLTLGEKLKSAKRWGNTREVRKLEKLVEIHGKSVRFNTGDKSSYQN